MISGAEERAKTATEARRGVKKGPWTASEDAILTKYVYKNGEGNWNMVQRNTGLARCGKSCRLRWANHLRPDLKKGSLSQDEEKIILDLHAKLGNKWARMASQLPGRTDNEIKNFWNTRMKRRQRAGLPIYPHDQPNQLINYNHHTLQYNLQNMSSHLHHHNLNQHSFTFSHHPTANNSHVSQFVPNFSNTNIAMSTIPYTFQYSSGLGRPLVVQELPSSQTPASSDHDHHTSDDHDNDNDHDYDHHVVSGQSDNWFAKSGLLGDLVVEGRAIARNKRAKKTSTASPETEEGSSCGGATENFGSADKSSIGIENDEDPIDMSSMEDDLMSLLNNFPSSTMPVPDWYPGGDRADSGAQNAKPDLADGKCEHLGSCHWNNMPRIC